MSQTEQQTEEKNKKTGEASDLPSGQTKPSSNNKNNKEEKENEDDNISWDDAFQEEAKAGSVAGNGVNNGVNANGKADSGAGKGADAAAEGAGEASAAEKNNKKEAKSADDDDDNISWDDAFQEEAKAEYGTEADAAAGTGETETNTQSKGAAGSGAGETFKHDIGSNAVAESVNKNGKPVSKSESNKNKFNVKKVEFASFDVNDKTAEPPKNLEFILDIPLSISVELGRTKMVINDMLQLGQGSVLELDKLAGEPLEVYVNNKLMAKGEVVLVNDKFGVRLTDIISPVERVQKL
ncbi:MAG: flagellar motor switch protein FliN [Candidatus Acididesulfobacter guangdongensis]|uniref:Flagellar motor switch protein FliN n=1 Tax=Acididesulfobacter guangdongensis TaxID=2597225 RepID=A0A519BG12_ACIG2|nr:MAG: flagellar motor switch protein FliN [Candidatus Acididesulfobacter guangdongensis]